jgi:hypothetical protein
MMLTVLSHGSGNKGLCITSIDAEIKYAQVRAVHPTISKVLYTFITNVILLEISGDANALGHQQWLLHHHHQ